LPIFYGTKKINAMQEVILLYICVIAFCSISGNIVV
jgi:hypothetical protein